MSFGSSRYPLILGGGTPLFSADGRRRALTLVETRDYVAGPTVSRYAVA